MKLLQEMLHLLEGKKIADDHYHVTDISDDGDYVMALVMKPGSSDGSEEYYGVNVLFYRNGKIDAACADDLSEKQWKVDRAKIITVAKKALKDADISIKESVVTEKVHTIHHQSIKPRGAPEDKARAFDKVNPKTGARPNRSVIKQMEKKARDNEFFGIDAEEQDDYTMCLVMSQTNSDDRNYYGVNVLFYKGGKIDAAIADAKSEKEWKSNRGLIIKAARAFLKKENAFSDDIDGPDDIPTMYKDAASAFFR